MSQAVHEYGRLILVCSRDSLVREGVSYEIEQVLARDAMEGGAELIIPVSIDSYVFSGWKPDKADVTNKTRSRVITMPGAHLNPRLREIIDSVAGGNSGKRMVETRGQGFDQISSLHDCAARR